MISEFKGEFRWLSNFATCYVTLDGVTYSSVEHAYMSAKSDDPTWKDFCQRCPQAATVKRESTDIKYIADWKLRKFEVMWFLLQQKFSTYPFCRQLLATGTDGIVEGNYHNDTVWGVCLRTGRGDNHLGRMIMDIRDRLRAAVDDGSFVADMVACEKQQLPIIPLQPEPTIIDRRRFVQ